MNLPRLSSLAQFAAYRMVQMTRTFDGNNTHHNNHVVHTKCHKLCAYVVYTN